MIFLQRGQRYLKLAEGDVIVVEGGQEEYVLAGDDVVRSEAADLRLEHEKSKWQQQQQQQHTTARHQTTSYQRSDRYSNKNGAPRCAPHRHPRAGG